MFGVRRMRNFGRTQGSLLNAPNGIHAGLSSSEWSATTRSSGSVQSSSRSVSRSIQAVTWHSLGATRRPMEARDA